MCCGVHSTCCTCSYAYRWKDNGLKLPLLTAVSIHAASHKSERCLMGLLSQEMWMIWHSNASPVCSTMVLTLYSII